MPSHRFRVLRFDLKGRRVVVEPSPWPHGCTPEQADPEVAMRNLPSASLEAEILEALSELRGADSDDDLHTLLQKVKDKLLRE